jgi:tape measure domain-containing protein
MGRFVKMTKDAGDEAERSRRKFQRFGDALNRIGGRMTSGIWGMATSILRAPFSLPGMLIGGAATYGAVRYGFTNPLRMASEFEQAEIAFTTMLGSAEKAREFIDEMNRFAVATPFDVAGVQEAAKRMLAFGFRQEQIIPYLTAIGNAAAGLGGGTDLIDRISLAIGQMQAKAKVSAEEMLQLTEAGIPAWEILAQKMGKTTREVMDLSSKGLIPASEAIAMLIEGMNERFPDMLEKQANSLDGLKNQIMETFNLVVVKRWGDGLSRALKPRLDTINRWVESNEGKLNRWGQALERVAFQGFDYFLRQGERAFDYIRVNYLENEEFQKLPFNKKIQTVFDDIERKFTTWYNSGGKQKIEEGANNFVSWSIGVLESSLPQMTEIGVKLGKEIGAGLIDGLKDAAKDHPILGGLVAGAATPGPWQVKLGVGLGVTAGSAIMGGVERYHERQEQERQERIERWDNFMQKLEEKPDDVPLYTGLSIEAPKKSYPDLSRMIPGHSSGLPYVPKDDYIARLHEGERVLTKQENREYTQQRAQAATPTISATINVNVSGSAAAGGMAVVKEAARRGAREGLEEFWRSMRRNMLVEVEI